MRTPCLAVLCVLLSAATARADDCGNATTQAAMTQCAIDAYTREDKLLNQTYKEVMAKLDPAHRKPLRQAQRDWIKYRDSHCKAEAASVQGGSLYGTVMNSCLAETTQARTKTLKAMGKRG